ncbi:hypothetical protein [Algoriphagus sp.]
MKSSMTSMPHTGMNIHHAKLGEVGGISKLFIHFQKDLYQGSVA